jgi:hypothetical protein
MIIIQLNRRSHYVSDRGDHQASLSVDNRHRHNQNPL